MNIRSEIAPRPAALRRPIYLDHHATTPVDRRVAALMLHVMTEKFGNPNDRGHLYGEEARRIVEDARVRVGGLFNAEPEGVVFAAGATTVADRLFRRLADMTRSRPLRVVTTTVEHHGVLDSLRRLERSGACEVRSLGVDEQARLSLAEVDAELAKGCDLLCVMAANNEVGTVNPIEKIAGLADSYGVPLFVDASQAAAYLAIDLSAWKITYLLVSAHKMYGPKGIAALITDTEGLGVVRNMELEEGTPNVPAIAGLAEACRICGSEMDESAARVGRLRDRLESLLRRGIDGLVVNGDPVNRLPHNLHVSVPDVPNDAVVARLSRSVALSTGSACRWGTDLPSHVLEAMRLPPGVVEGALRMGLGRETTVEEVDEAASLIVAAVAAVRRSMHGEG